VRRPLAALRDVACVAGSYLLGSLPFSYWIVRRSTGGDVRRMGSGNPGATNVLRVAGPRAAGTALAGDVGKGALAVVAARLAGAPPPVVAAAAVATTAGHVFPAFLGWRGGKGVATGFGALAALAPLPAAGSLGAFAATVAVGRYVSLGSLAGALSFPLFVALRRRRGDAPLLVAAGCIAALVLGRHGGNLKRLRRGSEQRFERATKEPGGAAGGVLGRGERRPMGAAH